MESPRPRGLMLIQACMVLLTVPTIALSYSTWWSEPLLLLDSLAGGVSLGWIAVVIALVWVWMGIDPHDIEQLNYIDDVLVDLVVAMTMLVISGTALAV